MSTATYCHHCGAEIVFNRTWPDPKHSHWAHAVRVFGGKSHSLENALMEQRCKDGVHWATPARNVVKWSEQVYDEPAMENSRHVPKPRFSNGAAGLKARTEKQ